MKLKAKVHRWSQDRFLKRMIMSYYEQAKLFSTTILNKRHQSFPSSPAGRCYKHNLSTASTKVL